MFELHKEYITKNGSHVVCMGENCFNVITGGHGSWSGIHGHSPGINPVYCTDASGIYKKQVDWLVDIDCYNKLHGLDIVL
jgi:hypothetical protein